VLRNPRGAMVITEERFAAGGTVLKLVLVTERVPTAA
jgi:hypothetical protein